MKIKSFWIVRDCRLLTGITDYYLVVDLRSKHYPHILDQWPYDKFSDNIPYMYGIASARKAWVEDGTELVSDIFSLPTKS